MGLLTIIKKQKIKDREIRCLILGLDNAGKSTIVNKLLPKDDQILDNEITPTIGFQIHSFYHSEHLITIWDIGGQSTLRPFWDNYFDKTDILIWCIDVNVQIRYDESIKELKNLINMNNDRIGYDFPILIVLNKTDLLLQQNDGNNLIEGKLLSLQDKVIKSLNLENKVTKNYEFIQCSASHGDGIENIMNSIIASSEYNS
ncbi:hypothetical protein TPHA_0G02120 [Tetrapisispora phaffii CBS 4417]|uniref:ADP-ribosylation factor-like protein 2 n=1 Tax=Tetrapisispora phaffii (strain ATCC 24235 / CBS 4417 / NBRC 1672 / NRRL Y-8282 / UCD 70-5) TaxID=1071381 RepID=G8BVX0_TETPH|nr:hypothetical protein TPHA_0G02120 [Tetrapisispora phaffii CBS 4417]CCE64048.1 hypothetical protein TPHA_0G02120 [Tetrapisispora phaffii CBS 4417]